MKEKKGSHYRLMKRPSSPASLKGGRADGVHVASLPFRLPSSFVRAFSRFPRYRLVQVSVDDALVRSSRLDPKQTRNCGNVYEPVDKQLAGNAPSLKSSSYLERRGWTLYAVDALVPYAFIARL